MLGMGLIVLGVVLIQLFSKTAGALSVHSEIH